MQRMRCGWLAVLRIWVSDINMLMHIGCLCGGRNGFGDKDADLYLQVI